MKKNIRINAFDVIIILAVLSFIPLIHLKINFGLDNLMPIGDPDTEFFQQFRKEFNSDVDDETIIITLENTNGIFQKDFLQKTDSLANYISRLDHIWKVYSLTNFNIIYFKDGSFNARPLIHVLQPELYTADSSYLFRSKEFRDLLISKNGKCIAIAAFNIPNLSDKEKDQLLEFIHSKINQFGFDRVHMVGKICIERIFNNEILSGFIKFLIIPVLTIGLLLFIFYGSFFLSFVSVIIIFLNDLLSLSLMSLFRYPIDLISCLIPVIIGLTCSFNIIYYVNAYHESLTNDLSKRDAMIKTKREINPIILFSSLGAISGILILGLINVTSIRNFAFITTIGILISCIVSNMVLFHFFDNTQISNGISEIHLIKKLQEKMNTLMTITGRKKYMIMTFFFILMICSVFLIKTIEFNQKILDGFPNRDQIKNDYQFIESDFYGIRRFEMVLMTNGPEHSFLDKELLKQVDEIENFLKDSCHVSYLISPISLFKGANKAYHGGDNSFFILPDSQVEINAFAENIMQTQYADELTRYMKQDGSKLRISGRLQDIGNTAFQKLLNHFDHFFKSNSYSSGFNYKITGSSYLLDSIENDLVKNLVCGILIAFFIILFIGIISLRSLSLALIGLIPCVGSLLITAGLMSLAGISLDPLTSLFFFISIAFVSLQTVPFMSQLRIELDAGLDIKSAVQKTCLKVIKVQIISSLVMIIGFLCLLTSNLRGLNILGVLIAVNLLISMVLHVILLPELVETLYKGKPIQAKRS